jgi:endonuclease YncB( thermonuclease family)
MTIPRFSPARALVVLPPKGKAETGDGDTMRLSLPFRLVSVDTPEKSNVGGKAPIAQKRLEAALAALGGIEAKGRLPAGFCAYLAPRIEGGGAARHYTAAEEATRRLRELRDEAMTGADGKERALAVIPAGEVVDGNGRMLAYVAPYLDAAERAKYGPTSKRRRTFNLALVAEGFAASFPIWPSFPSRREDLDAFLDAAISAHRYRKGSWAGGNHAALLTGYEFRALIKAGRLALDGKDGKAAKEKDYLDLFGRHCVDRAGTQHGRFGFFAVPHGERLWAWTAKDATALADWLGA